jgi:mono/diheme cytochrome c family protein
MSRALIVIAMVAAFSASAALAQAPALDGKALFHEKCAMCHGPGGMGTGLLARRVQPAELDKRTNLNADYVFQYARRGLGNMPPITPGEANDAQLRAIALYLAAGPKEAK